MRVSSKLIKSVGLGVRWRDPDLHEVIQFLGNPNPVVKVNSLGIDDCILKNWSKKMIFSGTGECSSLLATSELHGRHSER